MPQLEGSYETIDSAKVNAVLSLLFMTTQGPAEAYGTLVAAIYQLNSEFVETPSSIDELIAEISQSLQSIKVHGKPN